LKLSVLALHGVLSVGVLSLASPASAAAHPDDWKTPEAVVAAMYQTISADAGQARDWDRFRALFAKGAQLSIAVQSSAAKGIMSMGVEDLVAQTDAGYGATGFHETALVTKVETYGLMASVTSSYEVRLQHDAAKPLMRGMNHFQLLNDGERWWIVSNVGVVETPQAPLPQNFLAKQP
jgi:hypothetical protein